MPYGQGGPNGWTAAGEGLFALAQLLSERRRDRRVDERLERQEGIRREDARAAAYEQDMAQPGAMSLEQAAREIPIAGDSLRAIGNAENERAPIRFTPPAATQVEGVPVQHAPARITRSGAVIDPSRAAAQATQEAEIAGRRDLSGLRDQLMLQEEISQKFATPRELEPWERSPDEQGRILDWTRRHGDATRGPGTDRLPARPTLQQAKEYVFGAYAELDEAASAGRNEPVYRLPSWANPQVMDSMVRDVMAGKPLPQAPLPQARPIIVRPGGTDLPVSRQNPQGLTIPTPTTPTRAGAPGAVPAPRASAPVSAPARAGNAPGFQLTPAQQDSARTGGLIPVTQAEFDAIVAQEQAGELPKGYAAKHYTVGP